MPLEFFENRTFKSLNGYRYPVARNGFWIIFFFKFYFFVLHLGKRQTTYICLKPKIDPPYFFGVQQKVTGYTYTTPTQCQLPVQYRYSIKIEIIRQQLHPNIIFLGSLSMGKIFPKNFVKKELWKPVKGMCRSLGAFFQIGETKFWIN